MKALLTNGRLWLAVLALVQTIALKYLGVPSDIWMAVDAILVIMIGALTVDKASDKILAVWKEDLQIKRSLNKK